MLNIPAETQQSSDGDAHLTPEPQCAVYRWDTFGCQDFATKDAAAAFLKRRPQGDISEDQYQQEYEEFRQACKKMEPPVDLPMVPPRPAQASEVTDLTDEDGPVMFWRRGGDLQFTNSDQGWRGPIAVVGRSKADSPFTGPWLRDWLKVAPADDPTMYPFEEVIGTAALGLPGINCKLSSVWDFDRIEMESLRGQGHLRMRFIQVPSALADAAEIAFDLEDELKRSFPRSSPADIANFWSSIDVARHVTTICRNRILSMELLWRIGSYLHSNFQAVVGAVPKSAQTASPGASDQQSSETRRGGRGPIDRSKIYTRLAEIVKRIAADGPWLPEIDDICLELDECQVPSPNTWRDARKNHLGWYDQLCTGRGGRELVRKTIRNWLKGAKRAEIISGN